MNRNHPLPFPQRPRKRLETVDGKKYLLLNRTSERFRRPEEEKRVYISTLIRILKPILEMGYQYYRMPLPTAHYYFNQMPIYNHTNKNKDHINYGLLPLSMGSLAPSPFTVKEINGYIIFQWDYSILNREVHPTDKVIMVLLSSGSAAFVVDHYHLRYEREAKIKLPPPLKNTPLHCYLFFISPGKREVSNTTYTYYNR